MENRLLRAICFGLILIISSLIIWYTIDVLLIGFAAILLAIFLHAVGQGTKKITRLPYEVALISAMITILVILVLTFWLYSPLIAEQFRTLATQLPDAAIGLRNDIVSFFGKDYFSGDSIQKEFSLTNEKIFNRLVTVFSSTIGSIVSFVIFLIIGFYLAIAPKSYINWILTLMPAGKKERVREVMNKIGRSLNWWIIGKIFAMLSMGVLTFFGLYALNISLAFILALLAALLTFIPYVGAILSAIPAILIAFAQAPLSAVYVTLLYLGIQFIEGNFITPYIEQKTVSIPPAITILAQMLMLALIGPLGLALATPLVVLLLTLAHLDLLPHQSASHRK